MIGAGQAGGRVRPPYSRARGWQLDGATNYINLDSLSPYTNGGDFTSIVWMSAPGINADLRMLHAINDAVDGNRLLCRIQGNKDFIDFFDSGGVVVGTRHQSTDVVDGNPHSVVWSLTAAGALELYIDGESEFSAAGVTIPAADNDRQQVGMERDPGVDSDFFDGIIYQFALVQRVLTPAEVAATCSSIPEDIRELDPEFDFWLGDREAQDVTAVNRGRRVGVNGSYNAPANGSFVETGWGWQGVRVA